MFLGEIVLYVFGVFLTATALLRANTMRMRTGAAADWVGVRVAAMLILAFLVLMATRSLRFGVDTAAYVEVYRSYCDLGLRGHELSYVVSAVVLNIGMLGACDVSLLPAVWAGFVVGLLLLMPVRPVVRFCFTALLLFSLIGIELTTNALRQGLSVGVMMLAVATWPRTKWLAILLSGASVVLHSSAALVFVAFAFASFSWTRFLFLMAASVYSVYQLVDLGIQPVLLEPFLYEVQKYLGHQGDEIYVRMLSFAGVLGALAAPLLSTTSDARLKHLIGNPSYSLALKLSVTCLPFLALPYFGYRYIYGIYPPVLFLVLQTACELPLRRGRLLVLVAAVNIGIMLVWSQGSSYMNEVPFFD